MQNPKHCSKRASAPIAVTLYADVFFKKIESCSKTVFRKQVVKKLVVYFEYEQFIYIFKLYLQ
jgi:hypothetical protein